MSRISWKSHISVDPHLHHGTPCIRGTRIPVATIVGSLADGLTADEILDVFPQLTATDVQAALAYAAALLRRDL